MDRDNSEGYPDPTAYTALMAIAREEKAQAYLPLVFIASPFSGDTERNIMKAQGYYRFAVSKGCIPLAPHLHYPQFMDDGDKGPQELAIRFALILLGKCDELWVFGGRVSEGMGREIAKTNRRNIPIKYFNQTLQEVSNYGG